MSLLIELLKLEIRKVDSSFTYLSATELALDILPMVLENRSNYSNRWYVDAVTFRAICLSSDIRHLDNNVIDNIKTIVLSFLNKYNLKKGFRVTDYKCSANELIMEIDYEICYKY